MAQKEIAPRYGKGTYFLQSGVPNEGWTDHIFVDDFIHAKAGNGEFDPAGNPVLGIPMKTVEADNWLDARTKLWI